MCKQKGGGTCIGFNLYFAADFLMDRNMFIYIYPFYPADPTRNLQELQNFDKNKMLVAKQLQTYTVDIQYIFLYVKNSVDCNNMGRKQKIQCFTEGTAR